ncbi:N-acetylmuramoyl-L-alanine amidase-like domain-containing protein [Inhella gelatinilytica]|uniref:DUF1460 domain-containing protein n=1 Tax=Inhella gelatinilytica TaxID=2795030 RepID=A0A931IVY7_9BURK|nr:N-acetylmuramoyl-L-alanine amidase-like domain-containing protein [Inhella gelatinilytica]MBH9552000.1 DUF1460 domain-containing protein [Inhella gelatinilytica]
MAASRLPSLHPFRWRHCAVLLLIGLSGCVHAPKPWTADETRALMASGQSADHIAPLRERPLHQMDPTELDRYLGYLHAWQPQLRDRIAHLARKAIGQPYELYLLGEFPYELHDRQPLFNLGQSDCVVFAEHIYAMALSQSWAEFFWMLQRLRYRDGVIGVTTRNHYTEADWNPSNAWLVHDVTLELGGAAVRRYEQTINRARFFQDRYRLAHAAPVQRWVDHYLPLEALPAALDHLKTGDFVNVITGRGDAAWASHVGLVIRDGEDPPRLIHSAAPQVREESFESFIHTRQSRETPSDPQRPRLLGFKFLRLNEQPMPPPMAPQPRPPAPLRLPPPEARLAPSDNR